MNKYWLLIFVIIFFGCSTIKTKTEKMRILMLTRDMSISAQACRSPIQANKKFAHLYEKLSIAYGEHPSEKKLKNESAITDSDVSLGLDWYSEWQYCMASQVEAMGRIDPEMAIIGTRAIKKQIELVNEIVTVRPTYGHINRRILDIRIIFKDEMKLWADNLEHRLSVMENKERAESGEAFFSEVGKISKGVAMAFLETVAELAEMEILLAQSAASYAAAHPTYVVNPILTTKCSWFMDQLTCRSF
jgi:hypothetical protein